MEKNIYKNNFLDNIIFKISFPQQLLEENKIKRFYEKIKEEFKYHEIIYTQEFNINISNEKGNININQTPKSHLFFDEKTKEESGKIIQIEKNYLILDYKTKKSEYHEFEETYNPYKRSHECFQS